MVKFYKATHQKLVGYVQRWESMPQLMELLGTVLFGGDTCGFY